jgi:hypothetical protein
MKNENTYVFKKNIIISKERVKIVPNIGDVFNLCKNQKEVFNLLTNAKPNLEKFEESGCIIEYYSSKDLGEEVAGYQFCYELSINDIKYDFFGYGLKHKNEQPTRTFYLYKTE